MTTHPRVSIIMAVKNAARFLHEALDSIMAQRFVDYEIVLVDGHSTDDTTAIARSYPRTRLITQRSIGFATAWNEGIADARGEFIALLDSDDRWAPGKLDAQVTLLDANPDAAATVGRVKFFLTPGQTPPLGFRPALLDGDYIAHMPGALLARRWVFDRIGLFGADWHIASDIDWFAKLKDSTLTVVEAPDVVIYKRVHDRNLSYEAAKTPVIGVEVVRLLRDSISRRRGAQP